MAAAKSATLKGPSNIVAGDVSDFERRQSSNNKNRIQLEKYPLNSQKKGRSGVGTPYSGPQNKAGEGLSGLTGDPTFEFFGSPNRASGGGYAPVARQEQQRMQDAYARAMEDLGTKREMGNEAMAYQNAILKQQAAPKSSSGVSSIESNISSDMDAFEQKLRDKKMFEAQLASQQQQTQSMKVADELARLKLQQEEQKRAEIRSMLMNLMGSNGNAGTSGVAAKSWQEQLVDIGGQKFPMRVNSSESMLPQLLQSLSALAQ